jgi:hypothetical protein
LAYKLTRANFIEKISAVSQNHKKYYFDPESRNLNRKEFRPPFCMKTFHCALICACGRAAIEEDDKSKFPLATKK